MSLCTIEQTMGRIKAAKPESPVAVFLSRDHERLDVLFADTIHTRNRMTTDSQLVGVFDASMEPGRVRATIRTALRDRRPPGAHSLMCPAGPVRLFA